MKTFTALALWETVVVVLYGLFATYSTELQGNATITSNELAKDTVKTYYPVFQDVHIMIFVGFGFLMTFLKSHRFGSVALNFLAGAMALQTGILVNHFFHCATHNHWEPLTLNIKSLITGDFAAGAVLISLGAVLGRASPGQVMLMTLFELIFFAINESIAVTFYKAVDMGGSMIVHTFGSFFGLSVMFFMKKRTKDDHPENKSTYNSDLIAMIGTLFLWAFWPSFNGAMAVGNSQHRVIVNTVIGLTASCISAFAFSHLLRKRFDAEDILNATLAGGVAIGSSSDLVVAAYVSIIIGFLGGALSVIGFRYIGPFLKEKLYIHDTCGVNNLHGMPGILGAIIGSITAGTASKDVFGDSIGDVFPAMANGRSASEQAGYQLATLATTLAISILGGCGTGFLCSFLEPIDFEFTDKKWIKEVNDDEETGTTTISPAQ